MPPLSPSNRGLFRGPPPPSLGPQPPPPNSASSADWCPACRGRGPRALTSPTEGGGRLREGGDGPRLSTSESSLPGLVLLWNRRRGRVPGGRAREQRQGDGRAGIEGPRRAEGPAVIRRGDRGARRGGGQLVAAAVAAHLDGSELCPDHHGSGAVLQESVFPQCGRGA